MYLGFKSQVRQIIDKHFPPHISKRFSLRSDSEIFIPKEDEGVWLRHRHGTESVHILFDRVEIFEIPQSLDPRYAEVFFLLSFKQSLEDGTISIESVKEWTDNKTARSNKAKKNEKKKKNLEESYKWAKQNKLSVKQLNKKVNEVNQKIYQLKGGEDNGSTNTTTGKVSDVPTVISSSKRANEKKQQDS